MARAFVIGDIHGCSKTFTKLLLEEIKIKKTDRVYCIGDYIDRGNDSRGVIDLIIKLRLKGYKIHTLRGNHEQMMIDAPLNEIKLNHWLKNGGLNTLASFNAKTLNEVPDKYISFLKKTKHLIVTNKYIFVHAGLNFKAANPFKDKESMLWVRDSSLDALKLGGRLLIHGHSPVSLNSILKQHNEYRINIDAGCVFSEYPEFGHLIAVSLPDLKFIQVRNIDN